MRIKRTNISSLLLSAGLLLLSGCEGGSEQGLPNSDGRSVNAVHSSPGSAPTYSSKPIHSGLSTLERASPVIQIEKTATSPVGISHYESEIVEDSPLGTVKRDWEPIHSNYFSVPGLSLVSGRKYFVCVRAVDNNGVNSDRICSDGWEVDLQGNVAPSISVTNITRHYVRFSFTVGDAGFGLSSFRVSVTTQSQGGGEVKMGWTSINPTCAQPQIDGTCAMYWYFLNGINSKIGGGSYFLNIQATDKNGIESEIGGVALDVPVEVQFSLSYSYPLTVSEIHNGRTYKVNKLFRCTQSKTGTIQDLDKISTLFTDCTVTQADPAHYNINCPESNCTTARMTLNGPIYICPRYSTTIPDSCGWSWFSLN